MCCGRNESRKPKNPTTPTSDSLEAFTPRPRNRAHAAGVCIHPAVPPQAGPARADWLGSGAHDHDPVFHWSRPRLLGRGDGNWRDQSDAADERADNLLSYGLGIDDLTQAAVGHREQDQQR